MKTILKLITALLVIIFASTAARMDETRMTRTILDKAEIHRDTVLDYLGGRPVEGWRVVKQLGNSPKYYMERNII